MSGLADLSLVEAADAVRRGDATSQALLDACTEAVDRNGKARDAHLAHGMPP